MDSPTFTVSDLLVLNLVVIFTIGLSHKGTDEWFSNRFVQLLVMNNRQKRRVEDSSNKDKKQALVNWCKEILNRWNSKSVYNIVAGDETLSSWKLGNCLSVPKGIKSDKNGQRTLNAGYQKSGKTTKCVTSNNGLKLFFFSILFWIKLPKIIIIFYHVQIFYNSQI